VRSDLRIGLNGLRIVAGVRTMLDLRTAHPRIATWKIGEAAGRNLEARRTVRTSRVVTTAVVTRIAHLTKREIRETTATSRTDPE